MAILNNSNAISSGGYDINNSLRFRSSATAYLNRTPATASNQKTWTWSAWVKLGAISTNEQLFSAGTNANGVFYDGVAGGFGIDGFYNGTRVQRYTTAVYRDPSAWYHVVAVVDTTQATDTNRLKMYINGVQIALSIAGTGTYPALNSDGVINSVVVHAIGRRQNIPDLYYDGYMADINFIDGSAKTPSDFGETDTDTGSWKPKAYSGSYGTNGFYLKFSDIATTSGSNAGLGKDFSGNANYWNTNGISVTAGVTYDAMIDVPTNTSATVANYSTLNPLIPSTLTYSEANLTVQRTTSNWEATGSTISVSQGKWYAEFVWTAGTYAIIGVEDMDLVSTWDNEYIGYSANGRGYGWDGNVRNNASDSAYGSTFTTGDIIGVAIDMDNKFVYMSKNGVFQNSGVPTSGATGTGGLSLAGTNYIIGAAAYNATISANFGQRPFSYTPPTGFVRLNTYNLPDSTIKKGNTVMDATTYTGNGGTLSVTNAAAFKPDLVWMKARSIAYSHVLYDSVRGTGTTKALFSDLTDAEGSNSSNVNLTSYNSNGWSVGSTASTNIINASGETFVGWQWQAGQGSTSSNTSGSITSTTSVNATAGFSVITFTAPGSGSFTVGHGLGVAPKFIITKTRSNVDHWLIWHTSLGSSGYLIFTTSASATNSAIYNGLPTSALINYGSYLPANGSTYVSYAWAEIAGFSKFGSYTGNSSADGPFVYTGFRPKFVMIKRTDSVSNWIIYDAVRNTYNVVGQRLIPNLSSAEATVDAFDFLSNGFKLRTSDTDRNSGTIIYMAFAENPFKNANAR